MRKGQVNTERGLLFIEASFTTVELCLQEGYSYAFHSKELGCDLYSKCLDDKGYRHSFAVIEKL